MPCPQSSSKLHHQIHPTTATVGWWPGKFAHLYDLYLTIATLRADLPLIHYGLILSTTHASLTLHRGKLKDEVYKLFDKLIAFQFDRIVHQSIIQPNGILAPLQQFRRQLGVIQRAVQRHHLDESDPDNFIPEEGLTAILEDTENDGKEPFDPLADITLPQPLSTVAGSGTVISLAEAEQTTPVDVEDGPVLALLIALSLQTLRLGSLRKLNLQSPSSPQSASTIISL